jgi:hypothetical protein
MKITNGPWEAIKGHQTEPFGIKAGTRTIALVKSCRDETEGNAELMAKAPELLKCLRWYVENDETNEADPENEYWIDGKNRAKQALEGLPDTN